MSEAREVLADFLLQGHLTYRAPGLNGASDYECADALIRDLGAEGVVIVAASHIAALEAERDALKAARALKVNADVIAMILSEEGVREPSYLAVKIANELDPPNTPNYDPVQVARLYLALGETSTPLSHEAARRVDEIRAAYARGLERAAEIAEKAFSGLLAGPAIAAAIRSELAP